MLKFLRHYRPFIWPIILIVALTFAQVMANLELPRLMAKIIDNGILQNNQSIVYEVGFWMIMVTLGGTIAAVSAGYITAKVSAKLALNVRKKLFTKIESLSLREFKIFSTASLITRTTNDVEQVQRLTVMMLRMMLIAPLMAVGALINAIQTAANLTWIIVVALVFLALIVTVLFYKTVPKFKMLQKLVDRLNLVTRESLGGIRVVRAFNKEKMQEGKFDAVNQELKDMNLYVSRWMIIMEPVITLVMSFVMIAVIWFGAHLVSAGSLEVGNMMAFTQYTTRSLGAFLQVSMIFIMLPRAAVSGNRIEEVLSLESSVKNPKKPHKIKGKPAGRLEFKNVSFGYPDADELVLSDICFIAEPGKTTAIVGSTGSGKTALVDLIPRLYDVTGGKILLDDIDLREWDLGDLSKFVGYVPQKAILFSGTVAENVKYGNPNATEEQVQGVLSVAQATEFVNKFPKGLNNFIAQGGKNVSGGQKQRLSIARALALEPSVLIFDDSLSALDFKTDAKLRNALKEADIKTQIVVGQRISNIMSADNIIVLNKGKIVGQGTHKELLKSSEVYQEMARSQMTEEELSDE